MCYNRLSDAPAVTGLQVQQQLLNNFGLLCGFWIYKCFFFPFALFCPPSPLCLMPWGPSAQPLNSTVSTCDGSADRTLQWCKVCFCSETRNVFCAQKSTRMSRKHNYPGLFLVITVCETLYCQAQSSRLDSELQSKFTSWVSGCSDRWYTWSYICLIRRLPPSLSGVSSDTLFLLPTHHIYSVASSSVALSLKLSVSDVNGSIVT